LPEQDPELKYSQGAVLAACGEKQIAYAFLRKAVSENYCAHQALQSDPLLAGVRGDAEFRQIVQAAAECQQKFARRRGWSSRAHDGQQSKAGWAAGSNGMAKDAPSESIRANIFAPFFGGKSIRWSCLRC
jgi:hypothetical protein